ncbi:hypothetical protein D3218_19070 [Aureimonas flava]|uniref:Uncharacterized protein n=1 Tax=Aureimonas flava TaxID=2320271 RepID=A0A3A1WE76_9HYPH|nr:hypothetical protein [Aureimonas flava]RIX97165.1 hypothetical protein D3218_19070 [Aureimonas flava]
MAGALTMPLSGLHVTIGEARNAGPFTLYEGGREGPQLHGKVLLSETLAAPGTSTIVTPPYAYERGHLVASVRCSKDAWVAVGAAPNASTGPRDFLPANTDLDMIVSAGDRVAWLEA